MIIDSGLLVQDIRKAKKLSRQDLADILGVNQNLIVRIESGIVVPSIEVVAALVHQLGVNVNAFLRNNEPLFASTFSEHNKQLQHKVFVYEKLINKLCQEMGQHATT